MPVAAEREQLGEIIDLRVKRGLDAIYCDHMAIIAHKAPQLVLAVLLQNMTWEEAFVNNWRKTKQWRPGWEYILN